MNRILILSPSITEGDAVSNDAIGMRDVLIENGYIVDIYAETWDNSFVYIRPINALQKSLPSRNSILIFHHSTGWDRGLRILKQIACKKIIRYHNITPSNFFQGINSEYEASCRIGREQNNEIINIKCDIYMTCSKFSAQELINAGVKKEIVCVCPPFHHIDRLQDIEASQDIIDRYQDDQINILMVGRIAPNKNHAFLIDIFNLYKKVFNSKSRLFIVGRYDPRLSAYNNYILNKVRNYDLDDNVIFTGGISEEALKAYYKISHLFLTVSYHEGFCVPLVESMYMKKPIVALGSSAIPETLGRAGVVWDKEDVDLFATSLDVILRDLNYTRGLGLLGYERYKAKFDKKIIKDDFIKIINTCLKDN